MSSKKSLRHRTRNSVENVATQRPHTRGQSLKITGLNDDCLREIFFYLPVVDFCAIRASHRRFHGVADHYFTRKYLKIVDLYTIGNYANYTENAMVLKRFGHLMPFIKMKFCCGSERHVRPCFSMLRDCVAMRNLMLAECDLNSIPTNSLKIKNLKNLTEIVFYECIGTKIDFQRFLDACDSRKLTKLHFHTEISDGILACIAFQMENLQVLDIQIRTCSPLLLVNLSKLKNNKKLNTMNIICYKAVFFAPVINAVAHIDSLKCFLINDEMDVLPDARRSHIQAITDALNGLSNVPDFIIRTKRELPSIFIENVNKVVKYECLEIEKKS